VLQPQTSQTINAVSFWWLNHSRQSTVNAKRPSSTATGFYGGGDGGHRRPPSSQKQHEGGGGMVPYHIQKAHYRQQWNFISGTLPSSAPSVMKQQQKRQQMVYHTSYPVSPYNISISV
jgi:hypothetical protein